MGSPATRPIPAMTWRLALALSWASCGHQRVWTKVEESPNPLSVQCWAVRYPKAIDCSWTTNKATEMTPEPDLQASFIATYRFGMITQGETHPCLQPSPEAQSCVIPDIQMFSMIPYILNITVITQQGTRSKLVPFIAEHIIKPDPPESMSVSPIPGKQLRVQWEPPHSWPFPRYFPLKYLIRYQRQGAKRFQQVGPTEETFFILQGLRPRTQYQVQVAAGDFMDYGELSAWSTAVATTHGSK
ncbi:interleukin-27 subunit beta [Sarcophilus harrisii]|uniref:Interleukin-27 subunit beta n=1 Tax=Sarcophilus harrisii TaxID=9305 RepID=A0A7N4NR39_SARHA|nr:interleukin-27 subunit beta [Sarcophilus harrisii]